MAQSRILVALSSPWMGERFVAPLTDLAQRLSAEVIAAHVAEVQEEDEDESDARKRGQEMLKLMTDHLAAAGVKAESLMLFSDDVPKAIINTAKARDATLIVISRGQGGLIRGLFRRLQAGGISAAILRQAEIPVLVLPAQWQGRV